MFRYWSSVARRLDHSVSAVQVDRTRTVRRWVGGWCLGAYVVMENSSNGSDGRRENSIVSGQLGKGHASGNELANLRPMVLPLQLDDVARIY